ncbi:MAG: complex I subunit 5 family protein [Thermoplasmatota archaeon]
MIEQAPILIIITPLTGALLLEIISKLNPPERVEDILTLISLTIPVLLLFYFAPGALDSPIVYETGGWARPYGISLVLDSLSVLMASIVGIVTLSTFAYSLEARDMLPKGERYYFLYLFMTTGLYGVFLTGDLVNRYVFFELTVLTTYVLLTYTGKKESLKASYYYLIIGSVASFLFLIGIGLLYFNTGYLDIKVLSEVTPVISSTTRIIIFSFFFVAIGVKAGLIPFHTWLPNAHVSAPTPMTAVLAGVTVKTGVYIMIKMLMIGFDLSVILDILIIFGLLTALIGVLITFSYWNIKRILAWHTVSQIGLIIACISLWSPEGVSASLYHMVNHALFKTLLFLSAGAFAYTYKTWDIRKLPLLNGNLILVTSLLIGFLSLVGIPPLNGFYSKSFIFLAFSGSKLLLIILVIIQILTVLSIIRIFYHSDIKKHHKEAPVSILKPLIVLAGLCVFVGSTSTLWMKNVIIPAGKIIVDQSTVESGVYLELTTFTNLGGIILLLTIPAGVVLFVIKKRIDENNIFTSKFEILKNKLELYLKSFFVDVKLTDAIRYIIFGQLLILFLIFI